MQEHDGASPTVAGLAIGDLDAVDLPVTVVHHLNLLARSAPQVYLSSRVSASSRRRCPPATVP